MHQQTCDLFFHYKVDEYSNGGPRDKVSNRSSRIPSDGVNLERYPTPENGFMKLVSQIWE